MSKDKLLLVFLEFHLKPHHVCAPACRPLCAPVLSLVLVQGCIGCCPQAIVMGGDRPFGVWKAILRRAWCL